MNGFLQIELSPYKQTVKITVYEYFADLKL